MLGDLQGVALGDLPEVHTQILTQLPDPDPLWRPPHVAPSSTILYARARTLSGRNRTCDPLQSSGVDRSLPSEIHSRRLGTRSGVDSEGAR